MQKSLIGLLGLTTFHERPFSPLLGHHLGSRRILSAEGKSHQRTLSLGSQGNHFGTRIHPEQTSPKKCKEEIASNHVKCV